MSGQLALISGLVGFALPHLIAIVNNCRWAASTKAAVAFGLCVAASTVTCYATGHLDLTNWAAAAMTVFTAAQVSYKGLWHPIGTTTAIEEATSPAPPARKKARSKA